MNTHQIFIILVVNTRVLGGVADSLQQRRFTSIGPTDYKDSKASIFRSEGIGSRVTHGRCGWVRIERDSVGMPQRRSSWQWVRKPHTCPNFNLLCRLFLLFSQRYFSKIRPELQRGNGCQWLTSLGLPRDRFASPVWNVGLVRVDG